MLRAAAGFGLLMWFGAALALSRLRWFSRAPLVDRLRPYVTMTAGAPPPPPIRSVPGPVTTVVELFISLADRMARVAGVDDPVACRLARIHAPLDADGFRLHQLGWALGAVGIGAVVAVGTGLGAMAIFGVVLGAPIGACALAEHRLTAASRAWQRRVERELPVVAEQLAMLVSAGYSTGSALHRLAERGQGHMATDLAVVCARIRQGLSEADAVAEWAALADVAAVHRLARVLTRSCETPELGRLLSAEARGIRRELQRRVTAEADRRTQTVWIPVTVAALVPGVVFLALPFLHALRAFAAP